MQLILGVVAQIPVLGAIANYLLQGPFELGLCFILLALLQNKPTDCSMLFDGFKMFGTALATFLLKLIFTLLWTLLLIIPGIIASYRYSQAFYIIASGRQNEAMAAIDDSIEIMNGHKMRLFSLDVHFVFLSVLVALPFGAFLCLAYYMQGSYSDSFILPIMLFFFGFIYAVAMIFWITPYWMAARAAFYVDLVGSSNGLAVDPAYDTGNDTVNCGSST
ncbi:MAG: DUF975 family protein [Sedimentisphaerales bacterium]|nr:DUF975 family protein [Sedimentisphaerales bacterium]